MVACINADDFGRSKSRNQAIDVLMHQGVINQTSLIVNMPDTMNAVDLAMEHGYSDRVVLHLNLTLGEPLTEKIKKTPLCQQGVFSGMKNTFSTFRITRKRDCKRAIYAECEAQIQKYVELGFSVFHIDSHNWIHLSIPVWITILPLLRKYKVKSVRPMRLGLKKVHSFRPRAVCEALYYWLSDCLMKMSGLILCKYSSNLEEFLDYKKERAFVEVFTHPDISGDIIKDMSWSYKGDDYKSFCYVEEMANSLFENKASYTEYYSRKRRAK